MVSLLRYCKASWDTKSLSPRFSTCIWLILRSESTRGVRRYRQLHNGAVATPVCRSAVRRRTNDTLPLPATKTWQPSRHVRAVRLVLRTEGRPQLGLLVDEDGEVEDEDPHRRVPEEDDVPEEQRLPDDDRRERHVNRVPHVPVHASHHEVTRRGHGCGRPQPLKREPRERLQNDRDARQDQDGAHDTYGERFPRGRLEPPACDPPRPQTKDCPRSNYQEEGGPEDGDQAHGHLVWDGWRESSRKAEGGRRIADGIAKLR